MPVEGSGGGHAPAPKPAPQPPPSKPAEPPPSVPYNPYGYVPGGSSRAVGEAIEAQAIADPGPSPVLVPASIEDSIPPSTQVVLPSGEVTTFEDATSYDVPTPPSPGSPGAPFPVGTFNHDELEALWIKAGGAVADADTAAAIAQAESSGSADALDNTAYPDLPHYHPPSKGASKEYSVGLWQINVYAHTQWSDQSMRVPIENAKAAVTLRHGRGNFDDWSTYTDGTYLHYLRGEAPVVVSAGPPVVANRPAGAQSAWARVIDVFSETIPQRHDAVKSMRDDLIGVFKGG